ncbi:hypothetical protein [Cohnella rhizosphaerae]|uniref:Uncharacterized protein n=1 Tax=Cohnella rhizosphaerae TaxID=1457232 RepID=A0A9X4QRV7_9BACL|nr:hypothetical protein [Cohnella rhizosphaerae]MDG0808649.1 hypothetical protein [Cohnella rhizosphaerae]
MDFGATPAGFKRCWSIRRIGGKGLGSELLRLAEVALRVAGVQRITLGNDLHRRLFPGIPGELADTRRWFERRGYVHREDVCDLIKAYGPDERVGLPEFGGGAAARIAEPGDREALTAFMARCFPRNLGFAAPRLLGAGRHGARVRPARAGGRDRRLLPDERRGIALAGAKRILGAAVRGRSWAASARSASTRRAGGTGTASRSYRPPFTF